MKLRPEELKKLLNVKDEDLKTYTVDQLRLMLGVFHYLSRLMQREINAREEKGEIR